MSVLESIVDHLRPEWPFLLDYGNTYSYSDLENACKTLQHVYRKKMVKRVLICLPQCFEAYAAVLTAYATQVTFCLIRSDDPINRKAIFCNAFQPDLILAEQNNDIYQIDASAPCLAIHEVLANNLDGGAYCAGNPIAYALFTSGSTGFPKGVEIKRSALQRMIAWMRENFPIQHTDVCSQYAYMNFDMSLIDLFHAVSVGAALVPFPCFQDKLFPGKKIRDFGITFWHSVPNVIDILCTQNQCNPQTLNTIRQCKFGGEQIYASQLERWFEAIPACTCFLTYGTTEITFFCTCICVEKSTYRQFSKKNMALGHPIEGWNVLLDQINEEGYGEIVVYGEYIGERYLSGDPSNRFRTIQLCGEEKKAYFTGDYGMFFDGVLYYGGRRDFQVKKNGIRIDLSEVDRVFRAESGCIATYTLFYNGQIVLLYIGEERDESEIRAMLERELPIGYMPQLIFRREAFPRNNSGKLDRAAICAELLAEGKLREEGETNGYTV